MTLVIGMLKQVFEQQLCWAVHNFLSVWLVGHASFVGLAILMNSPTSVLPRPLDRPRDCRLKSLQPASCLFATVASHWRRMQLEPVYVQWPSKNIKKYHYQTTFLLDQLDQQYLETSWTCIDQNTRRWPRSYSQPFPSCGETHHGSHLLSSVIQWFPWSFCSQVRKMDTHFHCQRRTGSNAGDMSVCTRSERKVVPRIHDRHCIERLGKRWPLFWSWPRSPGLLWSLPSTWWSSLCPL